MVGQKCDICGATIQVGGDAMDGNTATVLAQAMADHKALYHQKTLTQADYSAMLEEMDNRVADELRTVTEAYDAKTVELRKFVQFSSETFAALGRRAEGSTLSAHDLIQFQTLSQKLADLVAEPKVPEATPPASA